jgi:colicin import membrane protein
LETDWKEALVPEARSPADIPESVLENLRAKFEAREQAAHSLEPAGVIKDASVGKEEINQFSDQWKQKGHSTEEPAFMDVVEQELAALKSGKGRTEEALKAATERLVKLTEDDSPEWRQMVEDLLRAQPMLEKATSYFDEDRRKKKSEKVPKKSLQDRIKELDAKVAESQALKQSAAAKREAAKKEAQKKEEAEKAAKAAAAAKAKADAKKK